MGVFYPTTHFLRRRDIKHVFVMLLLLLLCGAVRLTCLST